MVVNKSKMNLFRWVKRLDETSKDIAQLLQQEIEDFETKMEQLESKLYRFDDKMLMLEGKLNDKTKVLEDNVAAKVANYHDEHEKELTNQKKNISIKLNEIEVQLKEKDDEIKLPESKMQAETKSFHEKVE